MNRSNRLADIGSFSTARGSPTIVNSMLVFSILILPCQGRGNSYGDNRAGDMNSLIRPHFVLLHVVPMPLTATFPPRQLNELDGVL